MRKARAYFERGGERFDQGDLEGAISDLSKAIAYNNPQHIDSIRDRAYVTRGKAYELMGDVEKAFSHYNKIINSQGTVNAYAHFSAYAYRGTLNMRLGNYQQALNDLNYVIKNTDIVRDARRFDLFATYFNRALLNMVMNDLPSAISDLDISMKLNPNDIDVYLTRAEAYFRLAQYEKAIDDCRIAEKMDPLNAEIYFFKYRLNMRFGRLDDAITAGRRFLELDRGSDYDIRNKVQQDLANLLSQRGDLPDIF